MNIHNVVSVWHRTKHSKRGQLRRALFVSGLVFLVSACVAAPPRPSSELLLGDESDSLYDRVVTRIEDSGLPLPSNFPIDGAAGGLQPGDVIQVSYYLVPLNNPAAYRIAAGDILSVEVADHPDLSTGRIVVAPDGQISLSLLGSVRASRETFDSLASRVEFLYTLEDIKDPHVTISVVDRRSGPAQLVNQLLRASGQGGAITVTILDDMKIQLPMIDPIDVAREFGAVRDDIRDAYDRRFGPELDVVVNVLTRVDRIVYVLGEVRAARAISLGPGMTPLMAVATAGGLTKEADPRRVVLIRFDDRGDYNYWLINMKDGLTDLNYAGNFVRLLPNDIVFVPQSAIDEINVYIEKFVKKDLPVPLQTELGLRPRRNSFSPRTTVLSPPES